MLCTKPGYPMHQLRQNYAMNLYATTMNYHLSNQWLSINRFIAGTKKPT
ncbi:hypothetical protein VCHA50P415_40124 [Vibrio chagasii]|nr:hypothetical protein VCHA27O13_80074 [Vibrio chagasii]CAH6808500.1 hypothetical protein VCHA34P129_120122 [Vibrio chagasii]CAH6841440.1 hypothetical protein VCHA34P114_10456 [Vibrio chagasii]CAH6851305.1 hypothetical protein VCHA28FP16_10472 [Vibrio chagasii]CAH6886095.1 hypothetical protein VCHA35P150_20082 [Vibrio chagasii]